MGGAYGNVPAFLACLNDARRAACTAVLSVGNMLGFCQHTVEMIEHVQRHCAVSLSGVRERQVLLGQRQMVHARGFDNEEDDALELRHEKIVPEILSGVHTSALSRLPHVAVIATPHGKILLCHGSPESIDEHLMGDDATINRITAWMDEHGADICVCYSDGMPWMRTTKDGRLIIQCAAAGVPDNDGDTAVHYTIIDMTVAPYAELRRVTYDHQSWASHLLSMGVDPNDIFPLTTGRRAASQTKISTRSYRKPIRRNFSYL